MKDIGSTFNIYGNKWSQKAGRVIFPFLIQRAIDHQDPITYGELADKAEEAGIEFKTTHRGRRALSMNYPLGCVLRTLFEYQEESGIEIPYLTTLVVNKSTRRPTYFSEEYGWSDDQIQAAQAAIYNFEQWDAVLAELSRPIPIRDPDADFVLRVSRRVYIPEEGADFKLRVSRPIRIPNEDADFER